VREPVPGGGLTAAWFGARRADGTAPCLALTVLSPGAGDAAWQTPEEALTDRVTRKPVRWLPAVAWTAAGGCPAPSSPGRIVPITAHGAPAANGEALQRALQLAAPGDVLELADGDYEPPGGVLRLQGRADAPVVVRARGRRARLLAGAQENILRLDACQFLLIEGLVFAARRPEQEHAIFATNSHHLTIRGCTFGAGGDRAWDASPVLLGGANEHNLVEHNLVYTGTGTHAAHGIYFGEGHGGHGRITGNEIHYAGAPDSYPALIQVNANGQGAYEDVTIDGNTIVSDGPGGSGFALAGVKGITICGNSVSLKRNAEGRAGTFLATWGPWPVSAVQVRDNTFAFDAGPPGGRRGKHPLILEAPSEIRIENNRFFNLPPGDLAPGPWPAGVVFAANTLAAGSASGTAPAAGAAAREAGGPDGAVPQLPFTREPIGGLAFACCRWGAAAATGMPAVYGISYVAVDGERIWEIFGQDTRPDSEVFALTAGAARSFRRP
jgi:hypothetical protein